jgi:MoxR-like ATPase
LNGEQPPAVPQDVIFAARKEVAAIKVAEAAERYMVDLVIATREPQRHGGDLAKWIRLGASPRATICPGCRGAISRMVARAGFCFTG